MSGIEFTFFGNFFSSFRNKKELNLNQTSEQLIQEHLNLRHQLNLPDPDSITGQSFSDLNLERRKYYGQLLSLATQNKFIFKSKDFFQKHPEFGSYYLSKSNVLLINPKKINTITDPNTGRKYDRLSYLFDLTQELTRGLIKNSNPDISENDLARLSVLSVCPPSRITNNPDFATKIFPQLVENNLQTHQNLT